MRDIVYTFYTNGKKKVEYILELLGMVFLYLAEGIYVSARGSVNSVTDGKSR